MNCEKEKRQAALEDLVSTLQSVRQLVSHAVVVNMDINGTNNFHHKGSRLILAISSLIDVAMMEVSEWEA